MVAVASALRILDADDEAVFVALQDQRHQHGPMRHKDAYDGDPNTASVYDDMEIHKKYDFYDPEFKHLAPGLENSGKVDTTRIGHWYA